VAKARLSSSEVVDYVSDRFRQEVSAGHESAKMTEIKRQRTHAQGHNKTQGSAGAREGKLDQVKAIFSRRGPSPYIQETQSNIYNLKRAPRFARLPRGLSCEKRCHNVTMSTAGVVVGRWV